MTFHWFFFFFFFLTSTRILCWTNDMKTDKVGRNFTTTKRVGLETTPVSGLPVHYKRKKKKKENLKEVWWRKNDRVSSSKSKNWRDQGTGRVGFDKNHTKTPSSNQRETQLQTVKERHGHVICGPTRTHEGGVGGIILIPSLLEFRYDPLLWPESKRDSWTSNIREKNG